MDDNVEALPALRIVHTAKVDEVDEEAARIVRGENANDIAPMLGFGEKRQLIEGRLDLDRLFGEARYDDLPKLGVER